MLRRTAESFTAESLPIAPVADALPGRFSRIGLGCARMGSFNNPQPLADSIALIEAALEMGVTVLDTANIYGQGDSERAIGRALRGRRDAGWVVTKAGQVFSSRMRALRFAKPFLRPLLARRGDGASVVTARRASEMRADWSAPALKRSLDDSLRRLGTDHVDGFLLHSPPANVVADPVTGMMLAEARQAGKARHVGVSCDDLACVLATVALPAVSLIEMPYDLVLAIAGGPVAATLRERGIRVLARGVIGSGQGRDPAEAVGAALADPVVGCVLVGTTKRDHLRAVARVANGLA